MHSIGIMQGRLSDKDDVPLQSFPVGRWQKEFHSAKNIGFDAIEWLVDGVSDGINPIFTKDGRTEIRQICEDLDIKVASLCAHSLIDGRLLRVNSNVATDYLQNVIDCAYDFGISRVILPAMGKFSIREPNAIIKIIEVFENISFKDDIEILLETDQNCEYLIELIASINHPSIGVLFDLGNANALQLNFEHEIATLNKHIREIHVKDRRSSDGVTKRLGEAGTPFDLIANELKKIAWDGPFVLETPVFDNWESEAMHNYKFARSWSSNIRAPR